MARFKVGDVVRLVTSNRESYKIHERKLNDREKSWSYHIKDSKGRIYPTLVSERELRRVRR